MWNIAIVGTRGVPNRYGGFEQNAENLSLQFLRAGHKVTVFNPDDHPYPEASWMGVRIRRVFCRERVLRASGVFIYDYLSLKHALNEDFDIILELGYAPIALYHFLLKRLRRSRVVTNMDGLEWKRSKWGPLTRRLLLHCERKAARTSDALIADNRAIQGYLETKFRREVHFIPYGAEEVEATPEGTLERFAVERDGYYLVVARLEPENSIETILDGVLLSGDSRPVLVVGGYGTRYGSYLKRRYGRYDRIRFLGGIYEFDALNALRRHARLYFHGHSVGGTNPSLLEAMAAGAYIAAHDNPFNRSVLDGDGLYFRSAGDVADQIKRFEERRRDRFAEANQAKLKTVYNWSSVGQAYLGIFETVVARRT